MYRKFTFTADILKDVAMQEPLPQVSMLQAQTLLTQPPVLQALNTEVLLSSSLLKYDLTYKSPAKAVYTLQEPNEKSSVEHIDQLKSVLDNFTASLKILQLDLGQNKEDDDASLRAKTLAFLDTYKNDSDVAALREQELLENKELRSYQAIFEAREASDKDLKDEQKNLNDDASKLFHSGRLLLKETQAISGMHNQLLLLQRNVLKRLLALRENKQQLAIQITEARQQLDALNRTRLEDVGDYALAQRMVSEDWQQVEGKFQQRRSILEGYSGLYYVRVRETAVGSLLPNALALRSQSAGDVLPGCPDSDRELPDDLTVFMDTVLDIPLADWRHFQNDAHLLPSRVRQTQLFQQRQQRLSNKAGRSAGNTRQAQRLLPLMQINSQILVVFAGKTVPQTHSLQQQLSSAHGILSLEDVLNGSRSLLSGKAQTLQKQLSQACTCLLDLLAGVQPSIRFRWAQLVEDRGLPIEQPERWPNLADVEKADFNRVRTLVELVEWFYRQLSDSAGDNSRTAITHLLSACLLIAASDDPEQILQGQLQTLPGIFRPGEILRLNLNREAAPGTELQLLDARRQVVGIMRVDDHDQNGAVATLMQIYQPITVREGLSVSGKLALGRAVVR